MKKAIIWMLTLVLVIGSAIPVSASEPVDEADAYAVEDAVEETDIREDLEIITDDQEIEGDDIEALGQGAPEDILGPLTGPASTEEEPLDISNVWGSGDIERYTVSVKYGQTEIRKMINNVNNFRTSGKAWVWNSDNKTKQTNITSDALIYDYGLEKVAMQRAAELVFYYDHTRPNGDSPFSAYTFNAGAAGENIAIGTGSYTTEYIYNLWLEEDEKYQGQGHRRNMLNPNYGYIGIAHVKYGGCNYYVQEFSGYPSGEGVTAANDSSTAVEVEVLSSEIGKKSVKLSAESVSVTEGGTAALPSISATVRLSDQIYFAPDVKVGSDSGSWTSQDPSIAAIEGSYVRGLTPGKTKLDVTSAIYSGSVPCTVSPVKVTGISFTQSSIEILTGEEFDLGTLITLSPEAATLAGVKLKSDKKSVASVSSSGIVRAKAEGTAKITATSLNGKKKATISVKVKNEQIEGETFAVAVNGTVKLIPDPGFTVKKYKVKSGSKRVKVSKSGSVKAIKPGSAVVSMVGQYQTINYRIIIEKPVLKDRTIRLNDPFFVFDLISGTELLEPTGLTVSNEAVLQSYSDGEVIPLKNGKVKVKVKFEHGSVSAAYSVKMPAIKQSKVSVKKNKTLTLTTQNRHQSVNDLISYVSDNEDVVSVINPATGKIKAVGASGESTVVYLMVSGDVYDTVTVTVK